MLQFCAPPVLAPYVRRPRARVPPVSRRRDPGGFSLPPVVPARGAEFTRAVELLGSCTQRAGMRDKARAELVALVGGAPETKERAQQWKGALELLKKRERRVAHGAAYTATCSPLVGPALAESIQLPERDRKASRVFSLLDVQRRVFDRGETPRPRLMAEVEESIGYAPSCNRDVHRASRALVFLQRQRRSRERQPPKLPLESDSDMDMAHMLLGAYAVKSSVGAQTPLLIQLIGAKPRTRNVAKSWKKVVATAIRKKKRKERVAQRRQQIAAKREYRRLRKLSKAKAELEHQVGDLAPSADIPDVFHPAPLPSSENMFPANAGRPSAAQPFLKKLLAWPVRMTSLIADRLQRRL